MSSSKQASIKCASEADLQARYYPQGATVLQHQVVVAGIDSILNISRKLEENWHERGFKMTIHDTNDD